MQKLRCIWTVWIACGTAIFITSCGGGGGGGNSNPPPPVTYVLTVDSTLPASGVAIVVSPADNTGAANGTTSFTRTYNTGTTVTLTAPATSGNNTFVSWTGCTTANTVTCTVTLNANTTVTANYAVPAFVLTVNSATPSSGIPIAVAPADNNNAANGTTSFTRTYNAGTTVTLTAPATSGNNTFVSWSGCSTASTVTCTVTLNANTTVTANYAPTTYVLTVNSATPSSGIAIGVAPADNNNAGNGTTDFTRTYNTGTTVTLTAPATSGANTFVSWSGCSTASTVTCTVTLNANTTVTANYTPTNYVLTVNSTNPASGVTIDYGNPLNNLLLSGATPFTVTEPAGTTLRLTAPLAAGNNSFASWNGCTTASTVTCNVILNANTTVTANFALPTITSIKVTPAAATIGSQVQFAAAVSGTGNFSSAVKWSLTCPSCGTLSPGTLSASGLYTTPYPAPATVTVAATSTQDSTKSGSVTVTLSPPATAAGPALSVDVNNQTHPISPLIYGMNNYTLDSSVASAANIAIDRFGGDATSRYNYLLDVTSSAADWYFENQSGSGQEATSQFNQQVESDASVGARTLGTVDVLGWVAKDGTSCSYMASAFPNQVSFDPNRSNCGDGLYPEGTNGCTNSNGCNIPDPPGLASLTSTAVGPSFAGNWVAYLVGKFGTAANGGVFSYDLDNEPAWWDAVHRDVHPSPSTYDEVTNNGIATAKAIKAADPTASVQGPVVDYWWNYFYSKQDIENGWGAGPCYQPWDNPNDRKAHGGVPFIEYYLQQFAAASNTAGFRLLDYLDLHTYFAAQYNGSGVGLTTAGDTGEQQARLNSTRVFWDPTYTDSSGQFPQPNYLTDANYTSSCTVPAQAPQLIPMMQKWVASDYPGTKTAITEYNWGGQENINGAVAQADILGIFGAYGLDLGALWGPPDPATQVPGLVAFEIYRNYDGKKSTFGDTALSSTSANQGTLSVYGAVRSSDNAVTLVVINKTYGDLTSTVSLANLASTVTSAQAYLYSNANLAGIVGPSAVTVTPGSGGSASTIANYTFPAQSITLFVVPQ
jgi:hypothetical protein